ncbi:GNAT family N-acetyltransferase [Microvirga pudoricolor]|uniref:GNAT family N-acetyltransferase n=1 Tax=Microvirga pudoricolor TaxID=2778729 RepID=UPI00194E7631|nr:GNAT family N-acetyltransferase [Microvirga pudoricolor]MBM6596199.1 GNAT family N-acetyltransferase [Microvirga pudoricolor]
MILVRDAVEADVEGVARAHVRGWRETYAEFLSPPALQGLSVEERAAQWRGAFARPDPEAKVVVAEAADGEIVGFARGGPLRGKEPMLLGTETELYAIYLIDKVKRQGLGRRMMRDVFNHLATHGFASVGLWVLKENAPARRFYERLGGVAGPEQSFDIRGDWVTEIAYRFEPIPAL